MGGTSPPRAPLPPRWFIRLFWTAHRGLDRATRGRFALRAPKPGGWGTMRLTTIGRHSGQPRDVLLGYIEDGPNLTTLAMNGWGEPDPAWWLNLQAHPAATVRLAEGRPRPVTARAAEGDERERLWDRWRQVDRKLDTYAARRPRPTAVVVLEPSAH